MYLIRKSQRRKLPYQGLTHPLLPTGNSRRPYGGIAGLAGRPNLKLHVLLWIWQGFDNHKLKQQKKTLTNPGRSLTLRRYDVTTLQVSIKLPRMLRTATGARTSILACVRLALAMVHRGTPNTLEKPWLWCTGFSNTLELHGYGAHASLTQVVDRLWCRSWSTENALWWSVFSRPSH